MGIKYRQLSAFGPIGPEWELLHPQARLDMLGFIPTFLEDSDPRPAREQINDRYISGWDPFIGFRWDPADQSLNYPGDPPQRPIIRGRFRNETLLFYDHAWFVILQDDGSHEVARLD